MLRPSIFGRDSTVPTEQPPSANRGKEQTRPSRGAACHGRGTDDGDRCRLELVRLCSARPPRPARCRSPHPSPPGIAETDHAARSRDRRGLRIRQAHSRAQARGDPAGEGELGGGPFVHARLPQGSAAGDRGGVDEGAALRGADDEAGEGHRVAAHVEDAAAGEAIHLPVLRSVTARPVASQKVDDERRREHRRVDLNGFGQQGHRAADGSGHRADADDREADHDARGHVVDERGQHEAEGAHQHPEHQTDSHFAQQDEPHIPRPNVADRERSRDRARRLRPRVAADSGQERDEHGQHDRLLERRLEDLEHLHREQA